MRYRNYPAVLFCFITLSILVFAWLERDEFWYSAENGFGYSTQSSQRYSWSLNYRKSPYVGTRNALIGQNVDSFNIR